MSDARDTTEGFAAWLLKMATHPSWWVKVPAILALIYLTAIGVFWGLGVIDDNWPKAAHRIGPILQAVNINVNLAPLVAAILGSVLGALTAFGIGFFARRSIRSFAYFIGVQNGYQTAHFGRRLRRIEAKLGIESPPDPGPINLPSRRNKKLG